MSLASSHTPPGALLLLVLDSRAPTGGHNHSIGMESAISAGLVHHAGDVEQFCAGRLLTSGRVAAAFAAAACRHWHVVGVTSCDRDDNQPAASDGRPDRWAELDAEFDARTPSEALRAASRQLGNGLRRLARATMPDAELPAAHHPIVLGAAVGAAGGSPDLAARAAALSTVTVPASAAVRLLGLDPFTMYSVLAKLARDIDALSHDHATLPCDAAPALDLLADHHLTTEVRLFAS